MAWEYIELNICPTGDKPVFHAAQYDIGRPIIIKLKNGEDDFTPTDLDIELQVRKVDNNVVTAVPDSVDGNVVTFLTTEQMTACSGTNLCEVQLTSGDNTMATLHFYLVVQRDALQGGLSSQSEIHDLEDQIAAIVPEVIGDEYYTAAQVDELIDDIPTFDPSNYYDKTQLYTKTETNGLLAQKANVSSLAKVATTGDYDDLLNKPTIPDVSNYYTKSETYSQNEVDTLLSTKADAADLATVATTGDYDDLLNKPSIPAAQIQSDWDQSDSTQVDYIKNKPTIPAAQIQSDWSQADNTQVDYIKNKPTIPTKTSDLENDSWYVGLWQGVGDFALTNGQTGNLTLNEDISDAREILIGFYINIGTIGKRIRKTLLIPRYELYYAGMFFDEMATPTERIYFQLDRVDGTHLAISSCSIPGSLSNVGIKIYYR